jgi:hypothetical protein
MRRNGRDAPIPDLPALVPEWGGSTQSVPRCACDAYVTTIRSDTMAEVLR